ncbi:hypothetical protein [Denitromonas halophila]|uniref:Uncharacterized protein n=1 Tax=Denitromonas halophila TaxID=1629404 RepID=A0A557QLQ5_9RHOO|nr:hypothetical protein [Denitromonas halophila]TVO53831.1 hypothetical protein FHP91_13620 [Denitromonas halophila]
MDIDAIRRANLQTLLEEAGGSIDALAEKADANPKYLSQIQSGWMGKKDKKPRAVGSAMARRLEKACNKPAGWMDSQHGYSAPPANAAATQANEPGAAYHTRAPALACAKVLQEAVIAMAKQAGIDPITLATNTVSAQNKIADALIAQQQANASGDSGAFFSIDAKSVTASTSTKKNTGA